MDVGEGIAVETAIKLRHKEIGICSRYYPSHGGVLREERREEFYDLGLQLLSPAEESDSWHQ
jgi:hypothetical protein